MTFTKITYFLLKCLFQDYHQLYRYKHQASHVVSKVKIWEMQRYSKCVFPKLNKTEIWGWRCWTSPSYITVHILILVCVCIQKSHGFNRIYFQICMQSTIGKISESVHKDIHPSNLNMNERKEKSVEVFHKKIFLKIVCS